MLNTTTSSHRVPLAGCAPTPLASYLKALGVLRIVVEQADRDAKGCWDRDTFMLVSTLDAAALEEFLLERYRPTPLVAPWGARSGFYPGSSESSARAALDTISSSELHRLAPFRDTIAEVRVLLDRMGMTEKAADDAAKLALLRACRAELSDEVLPWLDACYVLTDEGRGFPPLLGTGGNEGSGSYVSAFAQLVVACLAERAHDHALAPALFATTRPDTGSDQTPGQFSPLAAGGANATSGFEGGGVLNPWDFLLCLEGTLLFAAAATKRLESTSSGALAFPFTVHTVGAGAGGVALGDEANARAETWFPLWDRPASLPELAAVLTEGRVQVSGRTARDALDFARAASTLGVERGIVAFQRYGYLQRFGRNVIAVPIERVEVTRNARGELADQLDQGEWLEQFRRLGRQTKPPAPARLQSLVRRLEDALFDLARSDAPWHVQTALIRLGEAQMYVGGSAHARDAVPPVPQLDGEWVLAADDGSAEFHIAAALAGLHAIELNDGIVRPTLRMAMHFAPVNGRGGWLESTEHNVTWGPDDLIGNLLALAQRRTLLSARARTEGPPWVGRLHVPPDVVAAWIAGRLGDTRIRDLLPGLVLARIPRRLNSYPAMDAPAPPAYSVLKSMFVADSGRDEATSHTREFGTIIRLLAANRVADAVKLGIRRMRARGQEPLMTLEHTAHPDGRRLLASLLVPLSDADLDRLVNRMVRSDERLATSATNMEA